MRPKAVPVSLEITGRRNKRWIIRGKLARDNDEIAAASRLTTRKPCIALLRSKYCILVTIGAVVACTTVSVTDGMYCACL